MSDKSERFPVDLAALSAAVENLDPLERAVFLLSAREALPVSKVARLLGLRAARTQRLLTRAIAKLDAEIAP